jgi:predicted nucleic acid-binding protein
MGQGFLMDTNAVIDYCGGKLPDAAMQKMHGITDSGFNISAVVKIEVLGFKGPPADMQKLESLLSLADLHYIDDAVIQKTIALRKTMKMKLGDAIIAATALVLGLTLLSRNLSDFKNIEGLTVIDPHGLK